MTYEKAPVKSVSSFDEDFSNKLSEVEAAFELRLENSLVNILSDDEAPFVQAFNREGNVAEQLFVEGSNNGLELHSGVCEVALTLAGLAKEHKYVALVLLDTDVEGNLYAAVGSNTPLTELGLLKEYKERLESLMTVQGIVVKPEGRCR